MDKKMLKITLERSAYDKKIFNAENRFMAVMPEKYNDQLLEWIYNANKKMECYI